MKKILELCGVVMTGAFLVTGCMTDDEATGEVEQLTSGSGASAVTFANATLGEGEFEIKWNGFVSKLEGETSLVTQDITIAPGGHSGWHSHPGPALVAVQQGALTLFYASNPCSGATYPTGTGFVDPGGPNTHIARNLSDVPVKVHVQYIVPTGSGPRIDQPAPALCP
jgi:hypothetical protein